MTDIQSEPEKLSQQDVERLLADPSDENRATTATKVASHFGATTLSAVERKQAEVILRLMTRDTAVMVREQLAENLKSSPDIPHDIALTLAKDVESVSLPVLEFSDVLKDEDLVDLVSQGSAEKQAAVAKRENVSEVVSGAIIEHGDENAVATLVENETAQIAEKGFQRAVDRFGSSERIQKPMVKRKKLPPTVAERLVGLVSEKLRDHLIKEHNITEDMADDMLLRTREQFVVSLVDGETPESDVEKLALQLKTQGRLTTSLILRSLFTGDLPLFEAALAMRSNVPLANARILIHDQGRLGLEALLQKSSMRPHLIDPMRIALKVNAEIDYDGEEDDRIRHRHKIIQLILTQCQDLPQAELDYLLNKLGDLIPEKAA